MLYGLEDYEYNEFSLMKQRKLNNKKVLLIVVVILACIFFAIGGFAVIYNQEDDTTKVYSVDEKNEIQKEEVAVITEKEESQEEKKVIIKPIKKEDELPSYEGNHRVIPAHDMEKIKEQFVPQFNENGHEEIKNIYFSEEKVVYLTFDDGPSKDITPQVLDILKEHNVKATFFVLGARVDLYPETLKRAFNEGHYIANHGYSHKYSKIYENKDTVFQEFVECEYSIKNALNNQDYNSYLFRFPGGSTGGRYEKIKAQAREHFQNYGVAFTNWNCLSGDAEGKETKEECIQEVINTKEGRGSLILLMHDANDKPQTVESLPEIIQLLKDDGYVFKTFYEIF